MALPPPPRPPDSRGTPRPARTDWSESNARVLAMIESWPEEDRNRFLSNRAEVANKLGVPLAECPMAVGFIDPNPIPPEDLKRARDFAIKQGWIT